MALLDNMVVPMEQRHAEGGSAVGPGRVTTGSSTRSIESTLPKEYKSPVGMGSRKETDESVWKRALGALMFQGLLEKESDSED